MKMIVGVSFTWISRVWVRVFGKTANNYNLGKQSPLTILFCLHLLPSKQFLVFKTSWRRLQDVFSVTIFRLWRRLLKTSCKYILKTSWKRLQDVLWDVLKASWRRLQDVFARRLQDVFKTSWRRLGRRKIVTLKTSWRRLGDVLEINKMFIGISLSNHSLLTNLNQYLTNLYLTNLYFTNLLCESKLH